MNALQQACPPAGGGAGGSTEAEQRLIEQALPVVHSVARALWLRWGGRHELDELAACGAEALVPLVRGYDPERAPLGPFLQRRLSWAIHDAVRRQNHTRTHAFRHPTLTVADGGAEVAPAAPSTDEEPAPSTDSARGPGVLVLGGDMADVPGAGEDPEQAAARASESRWLRRAVAGLPRRERALVEEHYFADLDLVRAGAALGISKSRASRIHARALGRLARELEPADDPAPASVSGRLNAPRRGRAPARACGRGRPRARRACLPGSAGA